MEGNEEVLKKIRIHTGSIVGSIGLNLVKFR